MADDRRVAARCLWPCRGRRTQTRATLLLAGWLALVLAGDALAGTLVTFNMGARGTFQIDLFDDLVPETVDNFLSYVNSGAYQNTLVHRSTHLADTGLEVIQGGGYTYNTTSGAFTPIPKSPAIALDYDRDNTRGTIAMARQTAPNTATSEWFINTADNSEVLGEDNNGGYTVFGWVVGTGMSVVDGIHDLPKRTVNGFTNVPVQGNPSGQPAQQNLIFTSNITVTALDHPSFQNPWLHNDVVNDGVFKAQDALAVVNDLLANGSHNVEGPFRGGHYLDVNGNGTVTSRDLHILITALLARGSATSGDALTAEALSAEAMATEVEATPLIVPEPSSLALAGLASAALVCFAWRRRLRLKG